MADPAPNPRRFGTGLADNLPQVAELELSSVVARSDGVLAVDGRVRVQAAEPADVYPRQLR